MATASNNNGLGFPAVNVPRAFDLRALQESVSNIRERFRRIDTVVGTLQLAVGDTTNAQQVALLNQQLNALAGRVSALEGALGVNDTTELIVDEAVAIGMPLVAAANGHCRIADPTDPTAVYAVIGLAAKAAAAGQTLTVQRRGLLSVSAVLEVGYAVYAGADGELVQHPSYGAVALPVGVAVSTNAVWIAPGAPSLLVSGFDAEHERYLPATVQLVTDALDLASQVAALPDGLFVKVGDALMPRKLVEGNQIWIDNPDGVDGNPVIRYVPAGAVRVLEEVGISDSCSAVLGP